MEGVNDCCRIRRAAVFYCSGSVRVYGYCGLRLCIEVSWRSLGVTVPRRLQWKLCHIKRDCPVHIRNMFKMSTIGQNARVQAFAKVVVSVSFVDRCLWQVITDLLLL